MVHHSAIPALSSLLNVGDTKIITVALEGLENILKAGQGKSGDINDRIIEIFSECGGLERIEGLQDHANVNVYNRALKILTTYFNAEDEAGSSVAPVVQGGQYGFGGAPPAPPSGFNF